jgi:hypothetical protein
MQLKTIVNAIIAKCLSPTKYDLIIIELSKVTMRLWMKKVANLCPNLILCLNLDKEKIVCKLWLEIYLCLKKNLKPQELHKENT